MATQTAISSLQAKPNDNSTVKPRLKRSSPSTSGPTFDTAPLQSVASHSTTMESLPHVAPTDPHAQVEIPDGKEKQDLPPRTSVEVSTHDPFHDLIPGYPKLAGRMGNMPEIGMFRRFGALNARSLLYYQNELAYLEDELKEVEAEDANSSEGKKIMYSHNAYWLNTADRTDTTDTNLRDGDMRQRELVLRIRCLLKEYNDALIQQATILQSMKEPDAFDLDDIQRWLASDHMKVLTGLDRTIWGSFEQPKDYSRELVVLRGRKDMDTFSRKIGARAIDWITNLGGKRWKKVDVRSGAIAVHEATVFQFTFWVTSAIASILPVVSIIILVNTNSLNGRLAIIAAFNVLTSVCLTIFTDARRTDVFAVTAAFAAVQVVFVGAALNKGPQEVVWAPGGTIPQCVCSQ